MTTSTTLMTIGVVISTYNHPQWLQKTLWGYACQTYRDFELIIADDGSNSATAKLIADVTRATFPNLKHIWHPDNGFQKCAILNKALLSAQSDYLIFTDQDCIPRADFVETHWRYAKPGYFLSGGYLRLPMNISLTITEADIAAQRAFELGWLKQQGLKHSFKNTKLLHSLLIASLMNSLTPTKATWNGMNASGWKADMLAVNGFNEQMQYGGEDREFGERLSNMGIRSQQIRYSAICLHLAHERPYKNKQALAANQTIRKETKRQRLTRTPYGIDKGPFPLTCGRKPL